MTTLGLLRTFALVSAGAMVSASCWPYQGAADTARNALQCEELDGIFPVPHRYDNLALSDAVFRGCGKYAVIRCTSTSAKESCALVEVRDAASAESPDG